MYRIDTATANAALPAPSAPGPNPNSYFTNGSPAGGVPATIVDAEWANMVQEELANLVTGAGLSLSKASRVQVLAAIHAIASGQFPYADDTGAANAYVIATGSAGYAEGQVRFIKIANANTAASTLNDSGNGAKAIVRRDGSALLPNDLPAGGEALVVYDGAEWQLLSVKANPALQLIQVSIDAPGAFVINIDPRAIPNSGWAKATGGGGQAGGTSGSDCGGGGQAGGTAEGPRAITPGGTINGTVGAGGSTGGAGADGQDGGATNDGVLNAPGGKGGHVVSDSAGGSGAAAPTGGVVNTPGGEGTDGSRTSNIAQWAKGGASVYGGGVRAGSGAAGTPAVAGEGGGAVYNTSASAGGAGMSGRYVLRYWIYA